MAGTTPIYGLPYPQSSDLVSAYPALGQDLAEDLDGILAAKLPGEVASSAPATATAGKVWVDSGTKQGFFGTGSAWVPFTGKVLQIVSGTRTGQVVSTSSTYADTGLSATITPSATTSKVLVFVTHNGCAKTLANTALDVRLLRASTGTEIASAVEVGNTADSSRNYVGSVTLMTIDSPSTTSATQYKTQFRSNQNIANVVVDQGSTSTIVLVEVAA